MTTCADCGREYRFMPDLGCPHCARVETLSVETLSVEALHEQLEDARRDVDFWRRCAIDLSKRRCDVDCEHCREDLDHRDIKPANQAVA